MRARRPGPAPQVPVRFWEECARLRSQLVGIASRHPAASGQAEDIVHDALVRAAGFRELDLDRLHPFLVTVVKRLCVDEARRRSTATRIHTHPKLCPESPDDPAERTCDQAEADWVVSSLGQLTDYERSLVALVASGHPHDDIARILGTTPRATQTALSRIRGKIKSWRKGD
ncbi:MAG: sigma-70 family RNA polymerase sigma factor [Kutzneria sp.]|nr:sigma-70 family RNA polymerase sigma factor [Kutzneria sp.]